jgi:hypothetical protein
MALAILSLLASEQARARFNIDTGTNRYYQLKIGRKLRHKNGIDWVDDIFFTTPMAINPAGGALLSTSSDISLALPKVDKGKTYVQLFSFKTPDGKSPAFSDVVGLPVGFAPTLSLGASMNTTDLLQPARRIPCQSYAEIYAQQASVEDLLSGILRVAAPTLLKLFGGEQNTNSAPASANGTGAQANLLGSLLNTILAGLSGKAGPAVSQTQSLNGADLNRFTNGHENGFSQPFIFGVDDALLGMLIGPVVQVLPQLMNAANQERIQMKQADNKLIADILAEDSRRLLLEKLQEMRPQAPSADLNQLIQLLQQPQTPTAANPTAQANPLTQSLSLSRHPADRLSKRAVVSFVTGAPVVWNDSQKILFAKDRAIQLNLRLDVLKPAPETALPKAIIKIIFKDGATQSILHEKTFKQKDILPGNVIACPFEPDELAHLPANQPITLFAEMRWLGTKTGRELKALGSTEIILVERYYLKERGKDLGAERELTDMKRFRPFWNKIWETPAQQPGEEKKYLWELNVNTKYSVLLTAQHETNGLMETKLLRSPQDQAGIAQKMEGRMKAGIELSLAQLNRLLPLWENEAPLDAEKMQAINTASFARNNACEFTSTLKLKGRARERGLLWVVPLFKLHELTLNTVNETDPSGQVLSATEEQLHFPLPVSARVIGLKSQ